MPSATANFAALALTIVSLMKVCGANRWTACLILGVAVLRFVPFKNHWLVAASRTIANIRKAFT